MGEGREGAGEGGAEQLHRKPQLGNRQAAARDGHNWVRKSVLGDSSRLSLGRRAGHSQLFGSVFAQNTCSTSGIAFGQMLYHKLSAFLIGAKGARRSLAVLALDPAVLALDLEQVLVESDIQKQKKMECRQMRVA